MSSTTHCRRLLIFCVLILFCSIFPVLKAKEQVITVGAIFPISGPLSSFGKESINGVKLALKERAGAKLQGKIIKLLLEDNRGEMKESAAAFKRLLAKGSPTAIIGAISSNSTLALASLAQKAEVPLFAPLPPLNLAGKKSTSFTTYTSFADSYQGVVMARFAYRHLKKIKAAILIDTKSLYSQQLAQQFQQEFLKLGGKLIPSKWLEYTPGTKDFKSILLALKKQRPDLVYLPGYANEVGPILKQARKMGINIPVLGGDSLDTPHLAQLAGADGLKNCYLSSHFSSGDQTSEAQAFVKSYQKSYGKKPGVMAALGYDAMKVVIDSLKRSGSTKGQKLIQAANQTRKLPGASGEIGINRSLGAQKSVVILKATTQGNIFYTKIDP